MSKRIAEKSKIQLEIEDNPYFKLGRACAIIGHLLINSSDNIGRRYALKFLAKEYPQMLDNPKLVKLKHELNV